MQRYSTYAAAKPMDFDMNSMVSQLSLLVGSENMPSVATMASTVMEMRRMWNIVFRIMMLFCRFIV